MRHILDKLGERYPQHDIVSSSEEFVNEVVQAAMTQENNLLAHDSSHHAAGEDDLMELFNQFARWM